MHDKTVLADEQVCRYIMDKNYFSKKELRVKHNAFMPAKNDELSLYRIDGLDHEEVKEIGTKYVAEPRGKALLGFASVKAAVLFDNGLRITGTEKPHPRHANVSNWPGGTTNKLKAIKIAEAATLELLPPPATSA